MPLDREAFFRARSASLGSVGEGGLIGTLGEKSMHAILKWYLDPDPAHHEIKHRGFFADILGDDGFVEIQTRALYRLSRKLDAFLADAPVTVVYPIARTRRLTWIDFKTGEFSDKRISPKKGRPTDVIPELSRIRSFIEHPGFRLRLILLDCDEYKYRSGGRSLGRAERIPYDIVDDRIYASKFDYASFLPEGLPAQFGSAEVARLGKMPRSTAGQLLLLLSELGLLLRVGKNGNAYIYQKTEIFPE